MGNWYNTIEWYIFVVKQKRKVKCVQPFVGGQQISIAGDEKKYSSI